MKLFGLRRKTRKSKPTSKPRIYKGTDADALKKRRLKKLLKKEVKDIMKKKQKMKRQRVIHFLQLTIITFIL